MKLDTIPQDRIAEVLKLALVDGLAIRAIARRLSMARKTVRKILGKQRPKASTSQGLPLLAHRCWRPTNSRFRSSSRTRRS